MFAVVLWACAGVQAQGQGKGQGGGDKERVKERGPQSSKTQENAPAPDAAAEKNAGKGKAAKQADEGATKQGKKGQTPTDTSDKGKGKGRDQQAQAFQKQQQHEQAKHMERVALGSRIGRQKDTEMVARVDKLIAKENEVYPQAGGCGTATAAGMTGGRPAPATAGPNDVATRASKSARTETEGRKQAGRRRQMKKKKADPSDEAGRMGTARRRTYFAIPLKMKG
jgi:hypothetical protein